MTYSQVDLGGSVVIDLVSKLPLNPHYHVYADNFFSSLNLADHLSEQSVVTTKHKSAQSCQPRRSLRRHEGKWTSGQDTANELLVAKWHDNAVVSVAVQGHGIEPLASLTGRKELRSSVITRIARVSRFLYQPILCNKMI